MSVATRCNSHTSASDSRLKPLSRLLALHVRTPVFGRPADPAVTIEPPFSAGGRERLNPVFRPVAPERPERLNPRFRPIGPTIEPGFSAGADPENRNDPLHPDRQRSSVNGIQWPRFVTNVKRSRVICDRVQGGNRIPNAALSGFDRHNWTIGPD